MASLAAGHVQRARLARPHASGRPRRNRAQLLGGDVVAHVDARLEVNPFGRHLLQAAIEDPLLQLEVGNAVAQQPADAIVFLEQRRRRGRSGPTAARRPVPPDRSRSPPRRLPLLRAGRSGRIHPSDQPRSAIWYSMCLMFTGRSLIDSVHDASHGAGQTRPVISGKLLVEWRFSDASRQRLR